VIYATDYSGNARGGDYVMRISQNGIGAVLSLLHKISDRLAVLEDTPYPGKNTVDCLLAHDATLGKCTTSVSRPWLHTLDPGIADEAKLWDATFVRTNQWFCAGTKCPMVIGNVIAYIDGEHVSQTYARYLARPLGAELTAAFDGRVA
jgi:hypothetical protein